MPIPKQLRIGYGTYRVESDKKTTDLLIEQQRAGSSAGDWLYIRVRHDLPYETRAETLLHEVLHMSIFGSGLDLDDIEEERIVRSLSMVLFRALRDNPELVEYLTEKT